MTTIVGIEYQGGVLIAGDRRACLGNQLETLDQPKVFRFNNAVIGVAGTLLVRQEIERALSDLAYIYKAKQQQPIVKIAHVIREVMSDATLTDLDRQAEFLVSIDGKLYVVTSDGAYLRATRGYAAIGSGAAYALGAIRGLHHAPDFDGCSDRACLIVALETAAEFDSGTGAPFDFLTLESQSEPEATT